MFYLDRRNYICTDAKMITLGDYFLTLIILHEHWSKIAKETANEKCN